MKTETHIDRARLAHHKALESLCTNGTPGLTLWRKLRRLEVEANAAATAQCNGEAYGGQPYRNEYGWQIFTAEITDQVAKTLGKLPEGFFINGDPRGYTLKIDSELANTEGLQKDWGGYGILAPEIN